MAKIGLIVGVQGDGPSLDVLIEIINNGVSNGLDVATFDPSGITTPAGYDAAVMAAAAAYASTNGLSSVIKCYTTPSDLSALGIPAGMVHAPQAAIADSPADATTNYNTITTLLGALTGAVNTANTKQNAIATQLNTLLAELRTLGLITS